MRLPIRVVRARAGALSASGETRNLSSGGVLFCSDADVEAGETIEYTIQLEGEQTGPALRCLGKVMRIRAGGGDEPSQVAATLERYEFLRAR
jgi:hypothetical protein